MGSSSYARSGTACIPAPPAHLRSRLTASRSISTAALHPRRPLSLPLPPSPPLSQPAALLAPTRGGGAFVPNCLSFEGYVRLFVL